MGFRILDASAFYAGVPFGSPEKCYTTPQVYDEISHIKKSYDALGVLLDTGRLRIMEPGDEYTDRARRAAGRTGDLAQMSEQDVSVIALCMETGGHIVSDDFAVLNVARNLGLESSPVMTRGIRDVGRWIHYCPGCRTKQAGGEPGRGGGGNTNRRECPACGTPLKRKLLKGRRASMRS